VVRDTILRLIRGQPPPRARVGTPCRVAATITLLASNPCRASFAVYPTPSPKLVANGHPAGSQQKMPHRQSRWSSRIGGTLIWQTAIGIGLLSSLSETLSSRRLYQSRSPASGKWSFDIPNESKYIPVPARGISYQAQRRRLSCKNTVRPAMFHRILITTHPIFCI
jgi:hypothetical protein